VSALVTSTERLQRLLALVPYVMSRKAVGLAETAAAFGVSERELVDDLNLLWCVELRAPDPYCPIDLSYEGGEIVVSQAESMGRPLRLAVDEASALLVALRMLAEVPGLEDRPARRPRRAPSWRCRSTSRTRTLPATPRRSAPPC
jgi:proteasome accessory factor C